MPELDFTAPFSLDGLAELIGDAKIVAIGENNHHIREFGALRDQVLRFLVDQHGFSVLGFESGFAERKLVDDWLRGGPGEPPPQPRLPALGERLQFRLQVRRVPRLADASPA